MKKIEIENKIYSVVDIEEYDKNNELYNPKRTAIRVGDNVLPIRNKYDNKPGIYYDPGSMANIIEKPKPTDTEYSVDKIIDFDNSKSIDDIFSKNKLLKNIEDEIMTNADNIACLKLNESTTPAMRALKTAINCKRIDPKLYEDRFDQFQNDMRLLKGDSITLDKLVNISNAFDISVELTLKDKNDDIPNPINREIKVSLTDMEGDD